jgi:hypothetical protein
MKANVIFVGLLSHGLKAVLPRLKVRGFHPQTVEASDKR